MKTASAIALWTIALLLLAHLLSAIAAAFQPPTECAITLYDGVGNLHEITGIRTPQI